MGFRQAICAMAVMAGSLGANDIVFLSGVVRMKDGSAPGKSVEILLDCKGADHPARQTVTGKDGKYHLKVERDEFDHVVRSLSATTVDMGGGAAPGACRVVAGLRGYESTGIELGKVLIGKNLSLPDLVLTPRPKP